MQKIFWIGYIILHIWTVVIVYQEFNFFFATLSLFIPIIPSFYFIYKTYLLFGLLPYHYFAFSVLLFWIFWKYVLLNKILSE
ncbi:MAG: hypothetical protein H6Q69_2150 [Firmicutes bacterium]|nr:hypothetical protein [Bacillota bacterium]